MLTQNKTRNKHYDNNLINWYMYINDGLMKPLQWQKPIFKILHYALAGKVSKINIEAPPQHGKTQLLVNAFTSFYMVNNPDDKVIATAYNEKRATKYGLILRDIINRYGQNTKFKPRIRQDQQSKSNFMFEYPHQGELLALGANGSIMGNPANYIIVDDILKGLKDANSKTMQENLKEWHIGTLSRRLRKNDVGREPLFIVVAQRLGLLDYQGILGELYDTIDGLEALEILDNGGSIPKDTFVRLSFPALCENTETDLLHRPVGAPLWSAHKNREELLHDKKMMGEYRFRTIMQCDPQEYKDYLFNKDMFYNMDGELTCTIPYNEVPSVPMIRFWDTAATSKDTKTGDYFVGIMQGYDYWQNETLYLFNMKRGKHKALTVINTIKNSIIKAGKDKGTYIQQEPGSMSVMFLQLLQQELKNYNIMYGVAEKNKLFSSVELQTLASEGRLKFVTYPNEGDEWIHTVIDELCHFDGEESTNNKHDDIVDSLSMGANYFLQNRNLYTPY